MQITTKLKCEHCNRRVNWNILVPVNGKEVRVRCPYCLHEVVITKDDINPAYHNIIFGEQE